MKAFILWREGKIVQRGKWEGRRVERERERFLILRERDLRTTEKQRGVDNC